MVVCNTIFRVGLIVEIFICWIWLVGDEINLQNLRYDDSSILRHMASMDSHGVRRGKASNNDLNAFSTRIMLEMPVHMPYLVLTNTWI